jgi:hypothetical protein
LLKWHDVETYMCDVAIFSIQHAQFLPNAITMDPQPLGAQPVRNIRHVRE